LAASDGTAAQDDGEEELSFSPMAMAKARKKEKRNVAPVRPGKARLSFGGDGEDEVSLRQTLFRFDSV
jgi:hypothetical protein